MVRIAVELDTRLDILKDRGETAKVFAYKYKTRQLTGLDEISRIVDTLLLMIIEPMFGGPNTSSTNLPEK